MAKKEAFKVDIKHYNLRAKEPMPFFLVLYDASVGRAYWLYVQDEFSASRPQERRKLAKTVTVRIPLKHEFGPETVDYMVAIYVNTKRG